MKTIWFTGIPASGKSTLATKLHLYLEHKGQATILLDDEAVKRASERQIHNAARELTKGSQIPYTIIVASTVVPMEFDGMIIQCECSIDIAANRDFERYPSDDTFAQRRHAFESSWGTWLGAQSPDLAINTTIQTPEECFNIIKKHL